jgi:transposase InsO family protein
LAGLKDLPPVHKTHPQATAPEVVGRILALALEHPAWGCRRLSALLKLAGTPVGSPTVQNILIKHDLATRSDRLLKPKETAAAEPIAPTAEQVRLIGRANPAFAERHVASSRPGELLCQDPFYGGHLKGIGKVCLDAVVHTYGSYAFGFLHTGKLPEAAAALLHNDVLPFYENRRLSVEAILTDHGKEDCGTEAHAYELYLALAGVEHRTTRVKHPWTNGFVERFRRTVLDEFFRSAFRTTLDESVEALQADRDDWLVHYNTERPHLGYRTRGKRPLDTIDDLASLREKSVA